MEQTAYLVLENGQQFKGRAFGAAGEAMGQTVFTTGMAGYLETLADPNHFGQIVVQTFPIIGNYGIIPSDLEDRQPVLNAYVVKHWCREPSNFRSEGDLDTFLKAKGIVGLCGVDTRTLTQMIREHGVMNGIITSDPGRVDWDALRNYRTKDIMARVGTDKPYHAASGGQYKVCLIDFGLKNSLIAELVRRDCDVTVLPPGSGPDVIAAYKPDGVMLSGGPGDPADCPEIVQNIKTLLDTGLPIFGVCLGHLLLAKAAGCEHIALKYGHRGVGQPVRDLSTGRVYVTEQNHGYAAVVGGAGKDRLRALFVNLNDGTCEGVEWPDKPAFSVQFTPRTCPGPQDTGFLYDRFVGMMGRPYRKECD